MNVLLLNNASPDLTAERISLKLLFAKSPLVSIYSATLMSQSIYTPSASLSRLLYCAVCRATSSGVDPANISSIFAYLPFFLVPFIVWEGERLRLLLPLALGASEDDMIIRSEGRELIKIFQYSELSGRVVISCLINREKVESLMSLASWFLIVRLELFWIEYHQSSCHPLNWEHQGPPGELFQRVNAQQLLMYSVAGEMAEPNPTIPAQGKLPRGPSYG